MAEGAIIARVLASPLEVDATAWNALLSLQSHPTPFMRHEYLAALHRSQSAVAETGWARYHAAAVIASNHLVALLGQAERVAAFLEH